jgi:Protein of unknown function (DUF2867)
MSPKVALVSVPRDSQIALHMPGADFFDTYEVADVDASMSAIEIYLRAVSRTPAWIEHLMSLRNRIVGVFGLKDLGSLGFVDGSKAAASYRVGDRVGIFVIHSLSEAEVVLADSDKHLDARVSVCKTGTCRRPSVAITTVVHVHNLLGRLYIAVVAPVHRIIVPAMLRRLASHRVLP